MILACALVARNGWRSLSANDDRVVELSAFLRSLDLHPAEVRGETFRNPNGVARKTADIATSHSDYAGRKTRGGSHDGKVLSEFIADPRWHERRSRRHTRSGSTGRAGIAR